MSSLEIALEFVARINAHDVPGLVRLMSERHVFVDSLGRRFEGRDGMRDGWSGYFTWMPDYRIEIERSLVDGDLVVLIGEAMGTYAPTGRFLRENGWRMPGCWVALISNGLVREWRVSTDNSVVNAIMERNRG